MGVAPIVGQVIFFSEQAGLSFQAVIKKESNRQEDIGSDRRPKSQEFFKIFAGIRIVIFPRTLAGSR